MSAVAAQIEARSKPVSRPVKHLPTTDGRSAHARRRKLIIAELLEQVAAHREPTQRDYTLASNIGALIMQSENMQAALARGELLNDPDALIRTANSIRRLLGSLGIDRAPPPPRPVLPSLAELLARNPAQSAQGASSAAGGTETAPARRLLSDPLNRKRERRHE